MADLPFPTIAAINGSCYSGGLELCLACDIRIASQNTELCFQETRLGLIPDLDLPLDVALKLEREQAADTILSGQCIEGIGAFLEKREPQWP